MITEHDLKEAIAECQGVRNPTANTCIKLAAYYTLMDHLYNENKTEIAEYSFTPAPMELPGDIVLFESDSDFSKVVRGMEAAKVWPVIDELMVTLEVLNPRLYGSVMRKLRG